VSRGLGPQQLRLICLASRWRGVPVGLVAELLGVSERRGRKIVESCVDRDLVVVVTDPVEGRRVWTPDAHAKWMRAQRHAAALAQSARLPSWSIRTAQRTGTAR
jgi:hypothetical protein